jgi:hypothetical protein
VLTNALILSYLIDYRFVEDIINTLKGVENDSSLMSSDSTTSAAPLDEALVTQLVALGFVDKDARLGGMEAAKVNATGSGNNSLALPLLGQ